MSTTKMYVALVAFGCAGAGKGPDSLEGRGEDAGSPSAPERGASRPADATVERAPPDEGSSRPGDARESAPSRDGAAPAANDGPNPPRDTQPPAEPGGSRGVPNPKLAGLAANTWMVLDSAGIQFDGHTAYSGGTYDRTNHQFLIFGGGHWDGWKNDVLAFDIAATTWKGMYTPDPMASYNCSNVNSMTPGILLNTRMPASRHTWDMIDFIDHLGKMIVWSGATYSGIWTCPGNTLPADTWLYDFRANKWEYKNVARNPQPWDEGGSGAYDPVHRRYWCLARNRATFEPFLWSYDPDADQWTRATPKGRVPTSDGMMVADRKRQVLYLYPHLYDIKANQWSTMSNTPSGLKGGSGSSGYVASFDEANDALVHVSNGQIFVYQIARGEWETLSPQGTPSIDVGGTFGRFFYDPVDRVHLFVKLGTSHRAVTYAYRYK